MPVENGTLRIDTARVYKPLLYPARYKGAWGGRGSAKSHTFADNLIDLCVSFPGLRAVCIREVQKSLKNSSKLLLEDKIKIHGLGEVFVPLTNEIRTPGGGRIIFQGMQDHTAESVKSLEGFDVAWVEEAQKLSAKSLRLLRPSIRHTPRSVLDTPEIWFSWNPQFPTDPVDEFLRKEPPEGAVVINANYDDNPWFPDELRREMEYDRRRDTSMYDHVWRGGYLVHSSARVFKNWTIEEFDSPSEKDVVFYFGADWGFSVDPAVLVRCFIDGRRLFIDREAYKVGCEIDKTPELFDNLDPDHPGMARKYTIRADSARPETISYMRRHGYEGMVPARKGPGSVEDGVEFLKNYDIIVHPRCVHAIDELTHYSYKIDKVTEEVLPILEDKKNNVIDAIRYALENVRHSVTGASHSEVSVVSRSYDGDVVERQIVDVGSSTYEYSDYGTGYYDGGLT